MSRDGHHSAASSSHSSRQYWMRREDPPSWLSWPGWLWLLGLLLLLLWGLFYTAPGMQQQVREQVSTNLAAGESGLGISNINVDADGQNVLVQAAGVNESLTHAVAASTQCDTWLGKFDCPIDVDVQLRSQEPQLAAVQEPASAAVQESRAHDFMALKTDGSVMLNGEVISEEQRQTMLEAFGSLGVSVDDKLGITGLESSNDDHWAMSQAVSLLGHTERGRVSWRDGVLSANVLLKSENEDAVRALFASEDAPQRFGQLDIQLLEVVNRCDQAFAELLSQNTIQFSTGSAEIAAESLELIQQVAALAADCDLRLDVEGHTDSVGAADMNKALSLARANSVVAALAQNGADADKLTAHGYGADRPTADNATAEGRRLNRRIEIRATEIN